MNKPENDNVHFLHMKIMNNGEANIYIKYTNSSLHMNQDKFEHWYTETAYIRALYDRAYRICSKDNLFKNQVLLGMFIIAKS